MMENFSKNLIDQDEYPMTRAHILFSFFALDKYSDYASRDDPHALRLHSGRPLERP